MTKSATDTGRTAEEMRDVRYLRAVIDTLRQELVTERKLVKGFEAEAAHLRAENGNLRDRVREAEKALKPFADIADECLPEPTGFYDEPLEVTVTPRQLHAVRAALNPNQEAGDHEPR